MTKNNPYLKTGYTSFEELYQAERPFILGIVLGRVGNRTIAKDLVQDIFIKILRNIDRYQPQEEKEARDSFRNWTSKITKNTTLNYFKRKRITQAYIDNQIENGNDKSPTPESLVIEKEGLETVVESIENISHPKKRETARLWFIEDKSYQEIKEKLGIPLGSVMSGLNRAKKEMKEFLRNEYAYDC